MRVELGQLVRDRYRLEAEIGRGGMAVVYRARDELLDRPVAVKLVTAERLGAPDREHLLREARLAARLNHPNIVAVYDAGEVDGAPFIVMELVEGASAFRQRPTALGDVLAVARQLCLALAHAHEHGVVHRDLKPENILRAGTDTVKLTDFGLALAPASRVTSDGVIVGSVFYLAPEQVHGGAVDGRADLYALGVLLYEWTTGELPFVAEEALAVITHHLYAPVIPPRAKVPSLPPALDRLIVRLLSKSREDRPASALEVLESMETPEAWSSGETQADIPTLERIGRGPIAGRGSELRQARGLWARAAAGKTQTLLVSGEPGIGKTRLVQELVALAEVSGGRVLQGWCYARTAEPFGPFKQILRTVVADLAPVVAAAPEFVAAGVLTLVPEYQPRFPDIHLPLSVDTAGDQQRQFEAVAILLSSLSQQTPVLLVVEDAHWADSGTLDLFRYLVQQTRERRVLFVLTHREVEPQDARRLHEVLHDFRRGNLAVPLPLRRLDRRQTEAMLASLLGEAAAPGVGDAVYGVTEGNPFFVEEVCRALAESGALVHADGRWQLPDSRKLRVPVNVRVAIADRLQALPSETRRALEVAALCGQQFEVDVVRRAVPLDEASASESFEPALRAKVIEEVPGDPAAYRFTHMLIPATIAEDLPAPQRRQLHARQAPALEALVPEAYESLAHHYRSAGEGSKPADYYVRAGERAYSLYALPEAIDHYTAGLEIQRALNQHEQAAQTAMHLGLAYSADFQFEKAQQAYEQAFDLWEHRPPPSLDPAAHGVTLRYAVDEPFTLDPGMVVDDLTAFIVGQLFEGLVEVDEAGGIVPAVARRWDVSDDGRHYFFHLRDGLRWSDDAPLTAADVEYAWKRNLSLGKDSIARLVLSGIAGASRHLDGLAPVSDVGVRALDDRTLEVRLEEPQGFFPLLLSMFVTYPLPRTVVDGPRQPWTEIESLVGNGPFRLAEWRRGEKMTFEPNPFYRGLRRGNVARIDAPVIGDYETVLVQFDEGKLDGISLLKMDPSTFQQRLHPAYRRELSMTPALSTLYLAFRSDRPPFDRALVRRAFAESIDREAFVQHTGVAYLRPARGGFLPPGMAGHSATAGPPFDPEEARRMLAEAGYPGGAGFPTAELAFGGDASSKANESNYLTATFLAQAWESTLGVRVRLTRLDWAELLRRGREDPPDLTIGGWSADYPDADSMLRVMVQGHSPLRWRNAEFDALVEEAARISDRKQRIELYQEADRILVAREAAVLPLAYAQGRRLVKPYVRLPRLPSSLMRLKDAFVDRP